MGATNTTTHYNLSQFISTDKPAWLQDYNGDMAKIDAGIDAAKVAADTAQTTANTANSAASQAASDITALGTTVNGQGTNITALQLAVNTINSLIGNGTPTTTDQTIIGAINEINANVNQLISSLVWNYVDVQTGNTHINLPTTYKEIRMIVQIANGSIVMDMDITAEFMTRIGLTDTRTTDIFSEFGTNSQTIVRFNKSEAWLLSIQNGGTDILATSKLYIYAK